MGFWRKQQLSLFLTSKCNLACHYCYIPKTRIDPEDQLISLDFAYAGLRDFFAAYPSRTIRFFGAGEPTQAFTRMVQITEVARQMAGPALRIELETNGYFDEDIANWIEDNVHILWISCDGPPAIQDTQRPTCDAQSSSDVVLGNVMRYAECGRMQFGVRATIVEKNLNRQTDLVEYFHSLGVKYLAASPAYHSKVNPSIKTPSLVEFARHFVPAFRRAVELDMFYQTLLMVNFDEEVSFYCQACEPCPRLTTDGLVSCCDWAAFGPKYLPGALQDCIYGRFDKQTRQIVYDQVRIDRIRLRNVSYLGQNACKGCIALRHCAGGCVGKMIAETSDLYQATTEWCTAVQYLFSHLPAVQGLFPYLHP